jgi:hypothetical protein
MPTIAIFQPDSRAGAHLRDVLTGDYDLRLVETWAELSRVVVNEPISACIVDMYGLGRTVPPERLGRLRKRRPDLAIVVYSDFSKNRLDPFELGKYGIDAVIDAGDDDPVEIRDALTRSHASATAGSVANDLQGHLPYWSTPYDGGWKTPSSGPSPPIWPGTWACRSTNWPGSSAL